MNTAELKKMLDKYYEGKTSEYEELAIRKFFAENGIPAGYETEKEIFDFYSGLENIPEPSPDFEEKIISAIGRNISGSGLTRERKIVLSLLSTAAGILILTGTYFFFIHHNQPRDTFSDPQLAYAETMKILYDVSSRLNKGTETLESLGKIHEISSKSFETINKSTVRVKENMKTLKYIEQATNLVNRQPEENINN